MNKSFAPAPAQDLAGYLKSYVQEILGEEDPGVVVDHYHTPDIEWHNDGICLDRDRLVAHALPARKNAVSCQVEVHDTLVVGNRVAARYTLHSTMRKGHRLSNEVYMFGELAPDGRLRRVRSTTRDVSQKGGETSMSAETTAQPEPGTGTTTESAAESAVDCFERQLEQYVQFWNVGTEPEQRRLAAAVFADGVEYRAQIGILSGPQALMDFRNQFAAHMGTVALRLRERPQVHHRRARLQWEILTGGGNGDGDGTSFATGTDVIQLDEDGRISSVTVFLDRAPEGFDPEAHH